MADIRDIFTSKPKKRTVPVVREPTVRTVPTQAESLRWWEIEELDTSPPREYVEPQQPEFKPPVPRFPKPKQKATWVDRYFFGPVRKAAGHGERVWEEVKTGLRDEYRDIKESLGLDSKERIEAAYRFQREPVTEPIAQVVSTIVEKRRAEGFGKRSALPGGAGLLEPEEVVDVAEAGLEVLGRAFERAFYSPTAFGAVVRAVSTGGKEVVESLDVLSKFVTREVGAIQRNVPTVNGKPVTSAISDVLPRFQVVREFGDTELPFPIPAFGPSIEPDTLFGRLFTEGQVNVSLGPSISETLTERFPDAEPEQLAQAQRDLDKIWPSIKWSEEEYVKFVDDWLKADDKETVLAMYEDPFKQMAAEFVLDPLSWAEAGILPFKAGIKIKREEKATRLALDAIENFGERYGFVDDVLETVRSVIKGPADEWDRAARYITGTLRTPAARFEKLTDIAYDIVNVSVGQLNLRFADEIVETFRNFDSIPISKSFEGRLFGDVLKQQGDDFWDGLKLTVRQIESESGPAEAVDYAKDEILRVFQKEVVSRFGDPAKRDWMNRVTSFQKGLFSPIFLGWNLTYPVLNFFDNARNIALDVGWRAAGSYAWDSAQALLRRGDIVKQSHTKYWESVGYIPRRAMEGFTTRSFQDEALGVLSPAGAERVRSFIDEIRRFTESPKEALGEIGKKIARGPTLALSGNVEEFAGANIVLRTHSKVLTELSRYGVGIRPLPDGIRTRLELAGDVGRGIEQIVSGIIDSPHIRTADDAIQAWKKWSRSILKKPSEGLWPRPLGYYLNRAFDSDTLEFISDDAELLNQLSKIEEVRSEGELIELRDEIFKSLDDFLVEVRRNRNAIEGIQLGWGAYDMEKIRTLAGTANSLVSDLPNVEEIALKKFSTYADIAWAMSNQLGKNPDHFFQPFTEAEVEVIKRSGSADELIQVFKKQIDERFGEGTWDRFVNPEWLAGPKRLSMDELRAMAFARGTRSKDEILGMSREELLDLLGRAHDWERVPGDVLEWEFSDFRSFLEQIGDMPNEQGQFWQMYNRLHPAAVRLAKKELPSFRTVARPGNAKREDYVTAIRDFSAWAEQVAERGIKVWLDEDELEIVQEIRKNLQRYHKYRIDPDVVRRTVDPSEMPIRAPRRPYPNGADVYQFIDDIVRPRLESLFDDVLNDVGPAFPELDRRLIRDIDKWFETEVRKDFVGVHYASVRHALAVRDFSILNYADKTYLDNVMAVVSPWAYWGMHNMWNWTLRLIDHPAIFSAFNRLQDTYSEMAQDDDIPPHIQRLYAEKDIPEEGFRIPSRLEGFAPIGEVTLRTKYLGILRQMAEMRGKVYVDFSPLLQPLGSLPLYGEVWMPDDPEEMRTGDLVYNLVKGSFGTGPFVDAAIVFVNNVLIPNLRNENSLLYNPDLADKLEEDYIPTNAMVQGGSFVPALRQIRAASVLGEPAIRMIAQRLGLNLMVPPTGFDLERPLRGTVVGEMLGLTKRTVIEDYWTRLHLAQLVAAGEISEDEAWDAMINSSGPAWNAAANRAAQQKAFSTVGRLATFGTARVKFLPDDETMLLGMKLLYNRALEAHRNGDKSALTVFYQNYPEYRLLQVGRKVWDVKTGKITYEELSEITEDELAVTKLFRGINDLDEKWYWIQNTLVPGTPFYERAQRGYQEEKRKLWEQYGDAYDRWVARREEEYAGRKAWNDLPKAKAMRNLLDMYFNADPKEREAIIQNLPTAMAISQAMAGGLDASNLVTQEDVEREIVSAYSPLDQAYAYLEKAYYDKIRELYSEENDFIVRHPQYARQFEEYLARGTARARAEYRKQNPEFWEAYEGWKSERNSFWNEVLEIGEEDIERMLSLHPDWRGTKREKELRQAVSEIPKYTLAEFSDRTKSDRDIVINQLWRFWTSLSKLDRKNWLSKFPDFTDFLDGNYANIPDYQLALWLRVVPDQYDDSGIVPLFKAPDYRKADYLENLKPPFGEGLPEEIVETGLIKEPEVKEETAFRPEVMIKAAGDGRVEKFVRPEYAEYAKKRAEALLNNRGNEEYASWSEMVRLDSDPDGAVDFARRSLRERGSLVRALKENPHTWERIIVGLMLMNEDEREELLIDYPDAAGIWEQVSKTEGPTYDMYYRLIGSDATKPFEPANPKDQAEYEQAFLIRQRAYTTEDKELRRELFNHPLVKKWFPPDTTESQFWELWYRIPKSLRREISRSEPIIKSILDRSSREVLDPIAYGRALEILSDYNISPSGKAVGEVRQKAKQVRRGQRIGRGPYRSSPSGTRVLWEDFQSAAGPLLMGELVEVLRGRRALSADASQALERIRNSMAPGMSLGDFIELLKALYIRYGLKIRVPQPIRPTGLESIRSGRRLPSGGRIFVRR